MTGVPVQILAITQFLPTLPQSAEWGTSSDLRIKKSAICYLDDIPPKVRVDTPGTPYHIIMSGPDQRKIFVDFFLAGSFWKPQTLLWKRTNPKIRGTSPNIPYRCEAAHQVLEIHKYFCGHTGFRVGVFVYIISYPLVNQ